MRSEFIGYVLFETDRALFFQDHFWHAGDWVPKSQSIISREDDTHEVRVSMSAWIIEKKEIEEFEERKNDGEGN
jgi:hypothetical protein